MAADVHNTVNSYTDRSRMRTKICHQRKLELFPPGDLLEFFAIAFYRRLLQTRSSNQFVIISTDRYNKVTPAIRTMKIMSTEVANFFFNPWVIPYVIPDIISSDNEQRFQAHLYLHVYILKSQKLANTAYRPQTNGQVKRYNWTLVSQHRLYVANNQHDQDPYV